MPSILQTQNGFARTVLIGNLIHSVPVGGAFPSGADGEVLQFINGTLSSAPLDANAVSYATPTTGPAAGANELQAAVDAINAAIEAGLGGGTAVNPSVVIDNGDGFTHTSGDGTVYNYTPPLDPTLTSDAVAGTITYTPAGGTATVIDVAALVGSDTLVDNADGTYTHTDLAGNDVVIDIPSQVAGLITQRLPFANALLFNRINTQYEPYTITGPTAFTLDATDEIPGATTTLELVADGTNIPTFPANFEEVTGSSQYVNQAGVTNYAQIHNINDGTYVYQWFTNLAVVPADIVPPVLQSVSLNAALDTIILTYNEVLDGASAPPSSAYTVVGKTVGTPVISGSTVEVPVTVAYSGGDLVDISYSVPASNPVADVDGNAAIAFSNETYTTAATLTAATFSTLVGATSPAPGEIDGNANPGAGVLTAVSSTSGDYVQYRITGNSSSAVIGFSAVGNTDYAWGQRPAGFYGGIFHNGVTAFYHNASTAPGNATLGSVSSGSYIRSTRVGDDIIVETSVTEDFATSTTLGTITGALSGVTDAEIKVLMAANHTTRQVRDLKHVIQ